MEALTIARIAERIESGSSGHALMTEAKSAGLLSGLSELVTPAVPVLSSVGTLEGLFCVESFPALLVVSPLFLADLGVS